MTGRMPHAVELDSPRPIRTKDRSPFQGLRFKGSSPSTLPNRRPRSAMRASMVRTTSSGTMGHGGSAPESPEGSEPEPTEGAEPEPTERAEPKLTEASSRVYGQRLEGPDLDALERLTEVAHPFPEGLDDAGEHLLREREQVILFLLDVTLDLFP